MEAGYLEFADQPFTIDAPARVNRGEGFSITISTYGGGCVSVDSTDVDVDADSISISPYDKRHIPSGDSGCTLILNRLVHTTEATFQTPGTKSVHVYGRRFSLEAGSAVSTFVQHDSTLEVD